MIMPTSGYVYKILSEEEKVIGKSGRRMVQGSKSSPAKGPAAGSLVNRRKSITTFEGSGLWALHEF